MKKLFCFLAVSSMVMTSCSSSDDNGGGPTPGVVLLKQTIETDAEGDTFTSTATYNGTKLNKITSDGGFTMNFTYSGDLITKIEYKESGTVVQTDKFTYNGSQQLTSYLRLEHDSEWGSKETYTYNGDGTVTVTAYSGDLAEQTTLDGTATITFLPNGEVATISSAFSDNHSYTYDDKNNPFKNVTGYGKISWVDTDATGIMHNVTNDTSWGGTTLVFTYNELGYPATATETFMGETTSTQFIYY